MSLKRTTNYINFLSIVLLIYMAFFFVPNAPRKSTIDDVIDGNFYLENAHQHVTNMTKAPHYVGALNHRTVKSYIIKELQKMGLSVITQKTTISDDRRTITQVENIMAKIEGSNKGGKSLIVMSHYDSEPYSALGAADASAGVAVILEGMRAFLRKNPNPKNDIIVLITDAEEIGLMGAKAFVNKHAWSDNVGAVLNFEARGSSGHSYLLMETNQGNHQMVNVINQAQLPFPASNSLAYSIYKVLPNDTDLTVFREDKNIPGFNFAFIDNHFNYHTVLDNVDNLSLDSLAHHAHQLMPMLMLLSDINLDQLNDNSDDVYLQIPFWKTVSYPFDWTLTISLINLLLFILVVIVGLKNKALQAKGIFSAGFSLLLALAATGLSSYVLLAIINWINPHYAEIRQGFTYNGHIYIALFAVLAFSCCFFCYRRIAQKTNASNIMVAPTGAWVLITLTTALILPGAHFFVIISLLATLTLAINVLKKQPQPTLTLLLMAPVILIFSPIASQLPIALGLKILPYSGILITLMLASFIVSIQIPGQYRITPWLFFMAFAGLFIHAESQSSISEQRPLPTSLYYYQSTDDKDNGYFFTYDRSLNKHIDEIFSEDRLIGKALDDFRSQHWPWANFVKKTENKNVKTAKITIIKQRRYSDKNIIQLKITTQRPVNLIRINTLNDLNIYQLAINKHKVINHKTTQNIKTDDPVVRIYTAGMVEFIIDLETSPEQTLNLEVTEISADLMSSPSFDVPKRSTQFIPKPFFSSDSIITRQKISTK